MDLNPDKIMQLPGIRESAYLVRFSSIRHTYARSASRIKVILGHSSGDMSEVGWGLGAPSESLDGFLEIRESELLDYDLISPSKFIEHGYSDHFCSCDL